MAVRPAKTGARVASPDMFCFQLQVCLRYNQFLEQQFIMSNHRFILYRHPLDPFLLIFTFYRYN